MIPMRYKGNYVCIYFGKINNIEVIYKKWRIPERLYDDSTLYHLTHVYSHVL